MGKRAAEIRKDSDRKIRENRLSESEKIFLSHRCAYEGKADHKRNPGDFNLSPPCQPRSDRTLCDEAEITTRAQASALLKKAIARGIVGGEVKGHPEYPKYLWVVDDRNQVFEITEGGSQLGRYHGHPMRKNSPMYNRILDLWNEN